MTDFKKHLIYCFLLIVCQMQLTAQNPDLLKRFQPHATYFRIENDTLTADGNRFFTDLFQDHLFILLGENHRSPRTSELTKCLLPLFHRQGGRFFGVEVGPTSALILQEIMDSDTRVGDGLSAINTRYAFRSKRGTYTPIPFFSSVSDAAFLETAAELNLQMVGVDQEFFYGFQLLLDRAYANLPDREKQDLRQTFAALTDTVATFYAAEKAYQNKEPGADQNFAILFKQSAFVQAALDRLAQSGPENARIIRHLRTSTDIYYYNRVGNWWDSNRLRTENFIDNFRQFLQNDFDPQNDKLLLKIGGLHAAKGINNYNYYDIGNAAYEYARFHGQSSCHLVFMSRYVERDGGERYDELSDTSSWYVRNFGDLIQLGRPDEWTILDLRPLRRFGLYSDTVHESVRTYFERYDVMVIPPTDGEPVLNLNTD